MHSERDRMARQPLGVDEALNADVGDLMTSTDGAW
jgi:hypothetical protein